MALQISLERDNIFHKSVACDIPFPWRNSPIFPGHSPFFFAQILSHLWEVSLVYCIEAIDYMPPNSPPKREGTYEKSRRRRRRRRRQQCRRHRRPQGWR